MNRSFALGTVAALACALALGTGCGDGDDQPPPPTATPEAEFGEAPPLNGTITGVLPSHGAVVTPAETTGQPGQFGGICAAVDFTGEMTPMWFHMIIDGSNQVTPELSWFLASVDVVPDTGRVCYQPEGGLEPGIHTVTVLVLDPENLGSPPDETVEWAFEVRP